MNCESPPGAVEQRNERPARSHATSPMIKFKIFDTKKSLRVCSSLFSTIHAHDALSAPG